MMDDTPCRRRDDSALEDDLASLPPLGSRCAGADCDAVPTHVERLVFDYGSYTLTHTLYLCGSHASPDSRRSTL